MCTRKLISEKNFSNLSTFALNVSIKTLLIAHIFFNKSEIFSGFKPKKKIEKKIDWMFEPMIGTQMEFRMDPNENLNARFSIVRAWQGYTVIGVLCIQTIPVLFSFFFSFSLSLFHSLFSLEPRVKTRRLTRFVTVRRSRLRKRSSEEKLFDGDTISRKFRLDAVSERFNFSLFFSI